MEYTVNNYNKNNSEIAGFINHVLKNRPANTEFIGSWSEVNEEDAKTNWDYIINSLNKIDGCLKLVKTRSNGEELILFLSKDTSTKNVRRINKEYSKILNSVDIYFGLLVLSESEFECWEDNSNNVVYWEENA